MTKRAKSSPENQAPQHRLRCFVAMAFGREDTDALYDNHIKKAVEAANMTPIRVDRVTHIDRIDARIRKEIELADIIVADLTYARPSVYWEAGFAERRAPVVYTCRKDHFNPRPDDVHGNFQVHFDLRNANIITWSQTGSKAFQKRLKKTLLVASRPLRKDKERVRQKLLAREEFSQLPQSQQNGLIIQATDITLAALGYSSLPEEYWLSQSLNGGKMYPTSWKKVGSVAYRVSRLGCYATLTKKDLEDISVLIGISAYTFSFWEELPGSITSLTRRRIRGLRRLLLIPVLGSLPPTRVSSVFPSWHKSSSLLHYYYMNPRLPVPRRGQTMTAISSSFELVFFHKIASVTEYREALFQVLSTEEGNRAPIVHPP